MRRLILLLSVIGSAILMSSRMVQSASAQKNDETWTSDFGVVKSELSATGRNPYFILEPGYQLVLESGKERLLVSVLDETKNIDGTDTRVVEERETKDGRPVEVSRNYFALNTRTNSILYFGEDVDSYKDGRIDNHEGSWTAGSGGAQFGLMMPGEVLLKARYYQEIAPKLAMDRGEIVSMSTTVQTPAGRFDRCVVVQETSPLETFNKEYKYYARGIGLIQDGSARLVKYGNAVEPRN